MRLACNKFPHLVEESLRLEAGRWRPTRHVANMRCSGARQQIIIDYSFNFFVA